MEYYLLTIDVLSLRLVIDAKLLASLEFLRLLVLLLTFAREKLRLFVGSFNELSFVFFVFLPHLFHQILAVVDVIRRIRELSFLESPLLANTCLSGSKSILHRIEAGVGSFKGHVQLRLSRIMLALYYSIKSHLLIEPKAILLSLMQPVLSLDVAILDESLLYVLLKARPDMLSHLIHSCYSLHEVGIYVVHLPNCCDSLTLLRYLAN